MSLLQTPLKRFENEGKPIEYFSTGEGQIVIFCHGFPELWYSWRHQIEPVSAAGFRVIVPNLRGYGNSYSPKEPSAYGLADIAQDLIRLLDHLGAADAIFVGHDWGGALVWLLAQLHGPRVRAVISLNTPFAAYSRMNPLEMLKRRPGKYAYQLYFQEPGLAEKELEADLTATFNAVFRTCKDKSESNILYHTSSALDRGGFLSASPSPSDLLTPEEIAVYVSAYRKSGFTGPLNWYRNLEQNWRAGEKTQGQVLQMPCLMVTADEDPILTPKMTVGMEKHIANLTVKNLTQCGHWSQQEKPQEVSQMIVEFLQTLL